MNPFGRILSALLLLPAALALLLWPAEAAAAVRDGLSLCANTVIPALFPFFVLSSMAVSLGVAQLLGSLLAPVMKPLFHVGPAGAGALVLGLIGGYPVGAKTVRQLYENGQCSRAEAQHLLAFCNNCGPAFILGAAGCAVFGSVRLGALLLASHVLGACSVGILFRFPARTTSPSAPPCAVQTVSLASAFTHAVQNALTSSLAVSAYVVLFSVLLRFLRLTGALSPFCALPNGAALAAGFLELSNGIGALTPGPNALPVAAFLLAFGGLSVQCQTLALLEGSGLDPRPEFLGKLLHGLLAALWTVALERLFPQAAQTMAGLAEPLRLTWPSLALTVNTVSWSVFLLGFGLLRRGGRRRHGR